MQAPSTKTIIEKALRKFLWRIAVAYRDEFSVATGEERELVETLRKYSRRCGKIPKDETKQMQLRSFQDKGSRL